jgi:alanyl-tRNA synthetase
MNRPYSSDEIRDTFLGFFTQRQHARIGSASIIPANDPSLLFINAGMAPLKPYFLGEALPPAPDLCNVQPCVRTVDIGDVGDRHHLTFFEMLGSWSIGHYFKDRAVELAFDLLTQGFGFAPGDLYMTVFAGDEELGIAADEVSAAAWERAGVARDHIVCLGAEDNFWSAGETGPCGPCTEVFYDTGPEHGAPYRPGGQFDTSRYIEIWNAGVFMEYNRLPGGRLEPLRFSSVDTGSGLERMAMVLQDRESAYETDLFAPVVAAVRAALSGSGAGQREVRIVADHVRASTFILSEGVAPSNEGRGYIPRRLLRKAIAIATQAGAAGFDLAEVADAVIVRMRGTYPQLAANRDRTLDLIAREQRDFGRVVRRGLDRLAALAAGPGAEISGDDAFLLFATHGMPADLIRDFAAERGGSVDERRFAELLAGHREVSRGGGPPSGAGGDAPAEADAELIAGLELAPTRFLGHGQLTAPARVTALAGPDGPARALTAGQRGLAVFDQTPFYAEGGGQVGDTGLITAPGLAARVTDTRNLAGHHVHDVEVTQGGLRTGDSVTLAVDAPRRRAVVRNHSATHLLHAALRRVLGPQVRQAGSLVAPDRLRFDFLHPVALTEDQTEEVERLVNAQVLENIERTTEVRPYADAVREGAIAFFGDKYGDDVRVVSFGDFSAELCGGTHVRESAEIGLFLIVSEGSIGSGVRRIEAVTGDAAVRRTLDRDRLLRGLAARLRVPVDQLPARVAALAARPGRPRDGGPAGLDAGHLAGAVRTAPSGRRYLVASDPGLVPSDLPGQARRLAGDLDATVVLVLPDQESGSLRIGVSVPSDVSAQAPATDVLDRVLAATGGHGGGSATFAQGGGVSFTRGGPAVSDNLSGIVSRIWRSLGDNLISS